MLAEASVGMTEGRVAAIQDIWDNFGCICSTLEITEESGTAGGNSKLGLLV